MSSILMGIVVTGDGRAGAPRAYQTAAGLATPGTAISYKVYVQLTTGNEAGSNAQTVFRPG